MDYVFLKNRNFDVDGAIERFAGKSDLYEKYRPLVKDFLEKKNELTFEIDCLTAEHNKKTKELKELINKYFNTLGVENNE